LIMIEEKVTAVPAQIVLEDAVIDMDGGSNGFTIIVTPLLVAVAGVAQIALELSTQVIISPLFSVLSVKLFVLEPTFTPFFFHWYTGEAPPLVIVDEKLTDVPAQMVLADAAIDIEGVSNGFTVIVIVLLVAVAGIAQLAEAVSTQEMISALLKVLSV